SSRGPRNTNIICENCKRRGHTKERCWARGGGQEGKGPTWYRAPKGMDANVSTTTS
ncbi:hypothetical protein F5890DRAFT_1380277, partial [Lentinula detonsa]